MDKQKKWQRYLIIAVIALTVYNILPTVFFYSKPLKAPIDAKRSEAIAEQIVSRVDALEPQSKEWLGSFCRLIKVKPQAITIRPEQPQLVSITFINNKDASKFREFLPKAGALIPFVPAQLSLYNSKDTSSKTVLVQRQIPIHWDSKQILTDTQFSLKFDELGHPTELYRALTLDRTLQIALALAGVSENAQFVKALTSHPSSEQAPEIAHLLAQNILSFTKVYPEDSEPAQRYFSSFTQIESENRSALIQNLLRALGSAKEAIKAEKNALEEESSKLKSEGQFFEIVKQQRLELLTSKEKNLELASAIIKRNAQAFSSGKSPLTLASFTACLQSNSQNRVQTVSLQGNNPFVETLSIDWNSEKIYLTLYSDVAQLRAKLDETNDRTGLRDRADQLLYNEIALVSRRTDEQISPHQNQFEIALSQLASGKSFLALKLNSVAAAKTHQLQEALKANWSPKHPDLSPSSFPIYDYETYQKLPLSEKNFGLVIYAPILSKETPPQGFHMNSIYVIAKGMDKFLQRLKNEQTSQQTPQFVQDFNHLREILEQNGFVGYSGGVHSLHPEFAADFIFEGEDYYQTLLKATRENFTVHGTKRFAILEYTDVEQRILTENKIDDGIHEDLLKWRDDYHAAKLGLRGVSTYDVPKPTTNVFWDNFKLSCVKYFRGDDRKILHWGLDLSGGKTVQIQLRDKGGRIVTNEADIQQGINELYNRVNKMGVSEVSIRSEGNFITLDFPGSQGLSAAELIKASSMYFHIVNEKFSGTNAELSDATRRFLQDIWNEAVITNRKGESEINRIAWKHLHGDSSDPDVIEPRSESARILYEHGLRFANPQETQISGALNETYSKIAMLRGNSFADWHGQTHPLIVVFRNFALEGSNLENIQASYDPSKGNYLSFSVRGSYTSKEGVKVNPQSELYAWTSLYAKEKMTGSPLEKFSNGRGWRMAVILNGSIISAPTLDAALKDSAMISGSFTQREVTQLEADLKAGSLSFTPHILSETNVSPELGAKERIHGIMATILSLILVMASMTFYYRFSGVIASIAVLVNLFIMWATLQNLQATMTLAGIAGIILSLGMAVDANVLVFERIREEFTATSRLASAVHAGYRKAFSAILDSNVTTIIAAMVLLHFDSGPIKQFAIMLIIGIISSMFTALFMTRFFFAGWVQNPNNKSLNMLNWFKRRNYNFLKHTRKTILLSSIIILVGGFTLITQRHTIFGMDFSGGYALNMELEPDAKEGYRHAVETALSKQGAGPQDFQIRELTPSNNIRIFLSRALSQPGHPFFGMPVENDLKEPLYRYELNPRIVWVTHALEQSGIKLTAQSLQNLDTNWTEVSGQMSDTMRNSALVGLAIALAAILIYITLRFEFHYAISATLCIAHDVIFTIATLGLMHCIGINIQIDLNTIAALMTIVGYSLNDTIIVFDRIREDVRLMRKSSFSDVINHALNVTLSRTIMTSGTTLLVLIPLIAFGGNTLFGFSLVMAIGVIFGTLSSLFIAAPLMKYFHDRELQKMSKIALNQR